MQVGMRFLQSVELFIYIIWKSAYMLCIGVGAEEGGTGSPPV